MSRVGRGTSSSGYGSSGRSGSTRRNGGYQQLEKEHLRQLINTRAEILHELNGSNEGDSVKLPKIWRDGGGRAATAASGASSSRPSRRGPRSVVDEAVSLSLTAPPASSTAANLMLSFRQFGSATRDAATRDGKRKKGRDNSGAPQQVVRLPIFRLPNANTQSLEKANQLELARQSTQHGQRKRQFLSFSDYKTMKKALLVMLQQLSEEEKDSLASACRVRLEDFDDALFQLKKRFGELGSQMTPAVAHYATTHVDAPHIMDDLFVIDEESVSLFLDAKATRSRGALRSDVSLSSQTQQHNSLSLAENMAKQKQSLRTLSSGMNLDTLGISAPFHISDEQ